MRWPLVAVCWVASCRGTPETTTVATPSPALRITGAPPPNVASATQPAPACSAIWRYALTAPLYSPVDNISSAQLQAMWPRLAMSAETRRALGAPSGPAAAAPTTKQWAIVPAHELTPAVQVITIDDVHPLDREVNGPLVATVCGEPNIDPAAVTKVAMTGVTAMARYTARLMDDKGVTYPARDVADWLGEADFVHASNEVSFAEDCEPAIERPSELFHKFCSRDSYIELLAAMHVNVIELTGSHLIDFGLSKLRRTIEMYEQRGWKFFGGGRDQIEATRPLLVEHNGNQVAFLGCNVPRSENATIVNGPNVAFCDLARLEWQVRDLKSRGITPIVSIQHNEVKNYTPPHSLVHEFRRLARAGAAAVLGSQAHIPHPFEVHGGAFVHYGLGNFVFDQPWVSTRDGVADRLYIHKGALLTVRRLYTRIEERGRPRPLDAPERARLLRILDDERAELPRTRTPKPPAAAPGIPDSFLVGKRPVYLWVAVADGNATVSLRAPARGVRTKQLEPAVTDFVATKYGIDRQRVTIR